MRANENPITDVQADTGKTSPQPVAFALFIRLGRIFYLPFVRLASGPAMTKKHRLILVTLFGICTLIYYFGELLDIVSWAAGHPHFLDEVHDIHRLLFLPQ